MAEKFNAEKYERDRRQVERMVKNGIIKDGGGWRPRVSMELKIALWVAGAVGLFWLGVIVLAVR